MAWVFNAATGKFEAKKGVAPAAKSGGQTPGPGNAKTPNVNIGKAKTTVQPVSPSGQPAAASPATTSFGPANRPRPKSTLADRDAQNTPLGPAYKGQMPPLNVGGATSTLDDIMNDINKVEDDAANFKNVNGENPPASWYETALLPINIKISERERLLKEATDRAERDAAARAAAARNAAERAAAEQERIRALRAGRQAEADLLNESERIKKEAIGRIAGLYDPMQTRSQEELQTALSNVATAFSNAETQVRSAGEQFAQSFQPSAAYEDVPFGTYETAANPLLTALRSQGAGTGEVEAATQLSNQSAQQTAALEKWAASQLGTSQKNYEEAMRRASSGGVTAALQDLAVRRPGVEAGVRSDYQRIIDELARERAGAESDADSAYNEAIAAANQMRAETTAKFTKPKVTQPKQKPKQGTSTPSSGRINKPR